MDQGAITKKPGCMLDMKTDFEAPNVRFYGVVNVNNLAMTELVADGGLIVDKERR